jgi:hypothetical protein
MQEPRIAIGLSASDNMPFDSAMCLLESMVNLPYPGIICAVKSSFIHNNRNMIVEKAKQAKCNYLMFLDTDMLYENDGIERLLKQDKDIIGGMYNFRRLPIENLVRDFEGQKETFKVDFLPTGFMLVKMEVFDKLEKPYFFFDYDDEHHLDGDDSYFCRKAVKAGISLWCDPTIKLRHIGLYNY